MDKLRTWLKGKLTKENMIVLALSGILVMVIALPVGGKKTKETPDSKSGLLDTEGVTMESERGDNLAEDTSADALERKLAEFLSCMDGVGNARVMITFSSSQERVVEKDIPYRTEQTSENDSSGGSRSILSDEKEEDTVYTTDGGGNQIPYVKKTLAAKVEGVTVLAQGGGSPVIQKNITDVIEALFGIEAHKIKVAKMK